MLISLRLWRFFQVRDQLDVVNLFWLTSVCQGRGGGVGRGRGGVPRSPAAARGGRAGARGGSPSAANPGLAAPSPLPGAEPRRRLPAARRWQRCGRGEARVAERGKRGEARRGRAGGRRRPHGQHGLRSHALAEVRARPGQPPAQNAARAGGARGLCRAARPRGTGGAGTPALPGRAAQLRSAPGRLPGRRGSVASRLIY